MNHWEALRPYLPQVAAKLELHRPPLLRVAVDGEPVLIAVCASSEALAAHGAFPGMPGFSLEVWLCDLLTRLERHYPHPAASVELFGQWPGNPPRLERLARVRPAVSNPSPRPETLSPVA